MASPVRGEKDLDQNLQYNVGNVLASYEGLSDLGELAHVHASFTWCSMPLSHDVQCNSSMVIKCTESQAPISLLHLHCLHWTALFITRLSY